VVILLIGLFGGLGLFLLGMSMMSEGLQNSAGNRMRTILQKLTHNRFLGLGFGAIVTMVIQSSSATNVMLVSFVNSKLMRFKQTISIMLGAAIGTTITAQIIAFKLTDYALVFVVLGLLIRYIAKRNQNKEIGKTILGFGILFFGMYIMSESVSPLKSYDPFIQLILRLEAPLIGIIIGALLTAIIQSSSAFIGILIILSMQGLLTVSAAIPLIIGANVGTAITTVLASLNGSKEAKQVALAHTLMKIIAATVAVFFIPTLIKIITALSSENLGLNGFNGDENIIYPRQIANAHTIFNIGLCILFLPVTNIYAKIISRILPMKEKAIPPFTLMHIDDSLLAAPSIALNAAREELVRMMKKVTYMTENIIQPFLNRNSDTLKEIEQEEEEINFLRDKIVDFLIKATQNDIPVESAEEAFIMMNAVKEYEQIADILSTQLKEKAVSWCISDYEFSEEGRNELIKYHEHTIAILQEAVTVYDDFNLKKAKNLKSQYHAYQEEYFELERQHYDRLKENIQSSIASSKTHLEIITLLRVVSSHATNTSRILLYRTSGNKKKDQNESRKPSN
jgi:phosphate:Na+ symporter